MTLIQQLQTTNDVETVSLFSGAGGLDIGAIHAGAKIIWANDMKKEACASYAHNIGEHIHQGDINTFIPSLSEYEGIDMVIGGPPCQGFSVAGKMDADDERSKLVWSYADVIETVRPRAFIMENVKALTVLDKWAEVRNKLIERFQSLGYAVNFCVVNACDYNVPQSRERVFFIGFKGNSFATPDLEAMTEDVPSYLRRLTVDEARVIQTFPLDYEFQGCQSAQYTQIGNAVPCNLAEAVCRMVIDVIKGKSPIVYSGLFQ